MTYHIVARVLKKTRPHCLTILTSSAQNMLRFTNHLSRKAGTYHASFQKGAVTVGGLLKVNSKTMNQQQRPFFEKLRTMVDYVNKGTISSEGMKDEKQLVSYFKSISLVHPKECIEQIQTGWLSGKVPANEDVIREYLKAAAALKKLDTLDITGLLNLARKEGILSNTNGGISPEAFFAALNSNKISGSTSNDPIFVKSKSCESYSKCCKNSI